MYSVYTEKNHSQITKTLVGEFKDYDEAMDCAEASVEGKPELRYIVEETDGHFNSYGELVTTIVAES